MALSYGGPHVQVAPVGAAEGGTEAEVEFSIVMPCLNEALTVGRCVDKAVRALEELGVAGEVIVADNGSTDGSREIARSHGARVVQVGVRGYGSAIQAGVAAAKGRFVIMGDSDDSYDFSRIEGLVDRLRQGDDLVMGNRFDGGIEPGAMPWLHQYFGNPFLTAVIRLFFKVPVKDTQCGLRGFTRSAFERMGLSSPGWEFASEMVAKASLKRQSISEVPVKLHPDGRDRPPHLRSFRAGWRNLRYLLMLCPRWLFLVPAVVLLAIGLALLVVLTPGSLAIGGVELDIHTMILGTLFLGLGYQMLWLWAAATVHVRNQGFGVSDQGFPRLPMGIDRFRLEHGLVAGLVMLAAGLGLNVWLVGHWSFRHLEPADLPLTLRIALWGCTVMALGGQTICGSFFLDMLERIRPPAVTTQEAVRSQAAAEPPLATIGPDGWGGHRS